MGQKTNPNIFRLGKTKSWALQHFEKKTTEASKYDFKNLEIKKFINKFFKNYGLIIHNCTIFYLDENSLHIFISYYLTFNSLNIVNSVNKNIKFDRNKIKHKKNFKYLVINQNIKPYKNYQNLAYQKLLSKTLQPQNYKISNKVIKLEKKSLKIRRIRPVKSYKQYLKIKNHINYKTIETNNFLEKFFESLHLFINKKINICLTIKNLNKNVNQNFNLKIIEILKKKFITLKKYEQNNFFKEGLNTLFIFTVKKDSAYLLAQFIAIQLRKLKKQNFFLRFIKDVLLIFFTYNTFSILQGIKIKIKGRFNGRPRSRHKIINIGKGVPNLKINSQIDYSEETSYTSNGTFGIKVWTYEK